MKTKIKKSTLLAIIVLTLLLHLLFLYFFTTVPFASAPDRISELIQKLLGNTPEQPEDKPQLQSHAPQQSAPVIFRDEPEEEIKPKPMPAPEPKTLVSHAANPLNKPVEQKEITKPVPQSIPQSFGRASAERKEEKPQEPEEEIEITKSVLRAPSVVADTMADKPDKLNDPSRLRDERIKEKPKKEEKNLPPVRPESIEGPPIKKEKTSLSVRPEALRDLSASVHAEASRSIEGHLKKSSLSAQNKKSTPPISLAQLSQQFMQKMATVETGGHGALRVEGNAAYGHPSAYQIALERYVAKMCTEIETAYRIGTNQSVQATQHKPFTLLVELNSTGALNTIYPSPSSGLARIDEFAISIFKSASKSFPKLPEAMGTTLRIQFGINHIDHLAQLSQGVLTSR